MDSMELAQIGDDGFARESSGTSGDARAEGGTIERRYLLCSHRKTSAKNR